MNDASINQEYEQQLIDAWEAVYKQGQLTLWIFLALGQSPKTIADIKEYLNTHTSGTLSADDKSIYRSLRKYYDTEMVDSVSKPSERGGPPLKVYSLTPIGHRVLENFVKRNVSILITNKQIKELL